MLSSAVRTAIFTKPYPYHDGIGYNARTGVAWAKVPSGALIRGGLTDVFTFTGDNKSYYMGGAGLLIPSVTNTPRIEYDIGGNLLGLLMEGARTNLALWSNDWTNAAWVATTMTTAKTATGPDGVSSSATTLTAAAGNSLSVQTVVSASATRTFSVWIKRRTGTGNVDLVVDGTTYNTKTITSAWAKYSITQAAVTNPIFGIRLVTSGDAVDVWCGQLESAVTYPSTAIPTTTVSVARAAETCTRTLGSEYSQTVGSMYVNFRTASAGITIPGPYFSIASGSTADRIIWYAQSGTTHLLVQTANVLQADVTVAGLSVDTSSKLAAAWTANSIQSAFNGTLGTEDTSCTVPGVIATLRLGHNPASGDNLDGNIMSFDYYPERKSNAFLQIAST